MKVRALEKIYYERRDRMPGEVFDMDDRESVNIRLLCVLKKIELVGRDEKVETAAMRPMDPPPERKDESPPAEASQDPERRRQYRRRDMRPRE